MANLLQMNSLPIWDFFDNSLADKIRRISNVMFYAEGQLIHSRGDQNPSFSIVKSGSAHAGIFGEDGQFVMTTILRPGQTFGEFTLFADLPRTHDITAFDRTEIYDLSERKFFALYDEEPAFARALFSSHLKRTHNLLELLDAMRRLPLRERTAKILINLLSANETYNVIECRQSDLAATLGVTRASLNKALQQLVELELIELGYGKIKISKKRKLSAWVTENCTQVGL